MNQKIILFIGITFWSFNAMSQGKLNDLYFRSSLQTILIESESFPQKDAVIKSWNGYPFPDKYDKHGIDYPTINLAKFHLSDLELKEMGYLKDTLSEFKLIKARAQNKGLRYLAADSSIAFGLPDEREEVDMRIKKAMKTDFFPNLLLQRWHDFNLESKALSFDIFKKRTNYNATNSDIRQSEIAVNKLNAIMNPALIDQLISNTFVTFTKLNFIENEPFAKLVRDAAILSINMSKQQEMIKEVSRKAAELLYQKTKDGYTLTSKTWLYKIAWNDSIKAYFNEKLSLNDGQIGSLLKGEKATLTPSQISFLSGDSVFKMEFVNNQVNSSIFLFAEGKTIEQIIDKVLVRNIDNAFAKLQKENDVFKPLVKIRSKEPLTAEIGMKEGLEGGEKFEVLELQEESGTGNILFKRVSTVKVVKGKVWDNRYNAGEKPKNDDGTDLVQSEFTEFKGSVKNGTFLRLIK